MTMLHVVADVRGEWGVFEDGSRRPLSLHPSATEAEFVAWVYADDRGSERIVGESWHHNHHASPRSAAHGLRWWELDLSALTIRLMRRAGLAWDVVLITPARQEQKLAAPAAPTS